MQELKVTIFAQGVPHRVRARKGGLPPACRVGKRWRPDQRRWLVNWCNAAAVVQRGRNWCDATAIHMQRPVYTDRHGIGIYRARTKNGTTDHEPVIETVSLFW